MSSHYDNEMISGEQLIDLKIIKDTMKSSHDTISEYYIPHLTRRLQLEAGHLSPVKSSIQAVKKRIFINTLSSKTRRRHVISRHDEGDHTEKMFLHPLALDTSEMVVSGKY